MAQPGGFLLAVDAEGKQLVDACAAGVVGARRRFEMQFLPLIYRFDGGAARHDPASGHDFLSFLFDGDRLYRRLQSFRGAAPLAAYLWSCVLPDLLKQFRAMIRRRRLDIVSFDEHVGRAALAQAVSPTDTDGAARVHVERLLQRLPLEKRLILKLLYVEDFDLEPTELQHLAERAGRTIREVLERIEAAREVVRSREAMQRARLDGAESAGQWIRLYERGLAQLDADLMGVDPSSPPSARLRAQKGELLRKLEKRRRQRAERLRASGRTVVTLPTEMVADLLGQPPSSTRSQITRTRQELAALLSSETDRDGRATAGGANE